MFLFSAAGKFGLYRLRSFQILFQCVWTISDYIVWFISSLVLIERHLTLQNIKENKIGLNIQVYPIKRTFQEAKSTKIYS